jgi:hypothetical protein
MEVRILGPLEVRAGEGAAIIRPGRPRKLLAVLVPRLALAAWRGPPLPEVADEEFAQADLQRLHEVRLTALEQRVDALLDLAATPRPSPNCITSSPSTRYASASTPS